VGLLFSEDRVPFLVKNPAYGTANVQDAVEREVPWRLIDAVVRSYREGTNIVGEYTGLRAWDVDVTLFVTPRSGPITVPFHTCNLQVRISGVTPALRAHLAVCASTVLQEAATALQKSPTLRPKCTSDLQELRLPVHDLRASGMTSPSTYLSVSS
jgi:hypothetical protein